MSSIDLPVPVQRFDRPIVLVGLMGVGKTTVGRRLARRLGWPFRDADHEIEASAGRSVSEIFADFGETAFRDGERKVIARLLETGEPMVLALGGGAFVSEETREVVKANALSVWLRADLDTLMERVSRRNTRPLLKTENPRAVMERLMQERAAFYSEADLAVDTGEGSHGRTVIAIIDALAHHLTQETSS